LKRGSRNLRGFEPKIRRRCGKAQESILKILKESEVRQDADEGTIQYLNPKH
jgi:hypothetical protein